MINYSNKPDFKLTNPYAIPECHEVMRLFQNISGSKILSGHHCNTKYTDELLEIESMTGEFPAVVGFDLMSYTSGAEAWMESCDELRDNYGSVESALYWAKERGALITACCHWYSPSGAQRSKSFYSRFTDFDFAKSWKAQDEDYYKLIDDIDLLAEQLQIFHRERVPVLWRPLHEVYGTWFWWGASGAHPYLELYRMMYQRFTEHHKLNNLIWVWNGHKPEFYPGDDVVDINGLDTYSYKLYAGDMATEYKELNNVTKGRKPLSLTEVGTPPDLELLQRNNIQWLWFMTWNGYHKREEFITPEILRGVLQHPYCMNLRDLNQWMQENKENGKKTKKKIL